eukprot:11249260-Ditylum_brightwellii.AAC.2
MKDHIGLRASQQQLLPLSLEIIWMPVGANGEADVISTINTVARILCAMPQYQSKSCFVDPKTKEQMSTQNYFPFKMGQSPVSYTHLTLPTN